MGTCFGRHRKPRSRPLPSQPTSIYRNSNKDSWGQSKARRSEGKAGPVVHRCLTNPSPSTSSTMAGLNQVALPAPVLEYLWCRTWDGSQTASQLPDLHWSQLTWIALWTLAGDRCLGVSAPSRSKMTSTCPLNYYRGMAPRVRGPKPDRKPVSFLEGAHRRRSNTAILPLESRHRVFLYGYPRFRPLEVTIRVCSGHDRTLVVSPHPLPGPRPNRSPPGRTNSPPAHHHGRHRPLRTSPRAAKSGGGSSCQGPSTRGRSAHRRAREGSP